jgi:NADH:ubiquinone oxidoreductase subunit 5 (subunit L)/multisubunit Na+/H+ antiporter MnhA subunit
MPYTAILFLIGSLAICGLPPFNGFISEYLIYVGMLKSLSEASLYQIVTVLISIVGLTLIGGLAIFCFTKAFGIVFLGQPRSNSTVKAKEVSISMIAPQIIIVIIILAIGLGSPFFVEPVFGIITEAFSLSNDVAIARSSLGSLQQISWLGGIFVVLIAALFVYRHFHLKTKKITSGPTWGCGYTAGTSKQQYTATSYADNFAYIADPVLGNKKVFRIIKETDIFPGKRKFLSHNYDIFKRYVIDNPVTILQNMLKKIAVMQTGQIQHYILYAFLFILLVYLLTLLQVI